MLTKSRWGRLAAATAIIIALAPGAGARTAAAEPVRAPWEGRLHTCLPEVRSGARCGTYEVFEDRDAHAGRKLALRIVVLPALGPRAAADPVFLLAGGPGESAVESVEEMARHPLRKRRDIVLIDTRGTGASHPLACNLWGDGTRLDHIFPLDAVRRCRDELSRGADLTRYTTAAAMDDVEEVRRYLGYGKVNLVGISYGTMAAQVFLARHPDSVRSVVLSGVVRPGDPSPLYHARNAERAMDLLARDCAHDTACRAAFPRFRDELPELLDRLARQPARVRVTLPEEKRAVEVTLTRSAAADAIRFSLYSAKSGNLPKRIHVAAGGDYRELALAAVELRSVLQQELALGLLFSVSCAEDLSRIDPLEIPRATGGTFYGDDRVREQLAVCAIWPHAPRPPGPGTLPPSPVPALLFSGERDPVTPPADAAEVAKGFANGLWLMIPNGTHDWGSDCEQRLIGDFVERGTVHGLDASCARQPQRQRFVTR